MADSPAPHGARPGSPLVALLGLVLMALLAVAVLMPTPWLEQVRAREQQWLRQDLGDLTAAAIEDQAARWLAEQVAASRPRAASPPAFQAAQALPGLAGADPAWLNDRLAAGWLLLDLGFRRAALVLAWAPAMLLLLLAGVLDGHWRWRIRQLGFDYPSPVARQASQTGLALVVGLLLLALLLPWPLHPFVLPSLVLVAVVCLGISLTHRPKQL